MRRWTEPEQGQSGQTLLILSFVIGALVGLVVVAFILLTGRLAARMYPPGGAAWRRVLIPVLGALSSGWLLTKYFPNARGSGIPQTKFALFIHEGYISLKTVLGKFLCCSLSLASGIALGREGPSVQIGAGISSVLGRRCGLQPDDVKALIPVGCSAALAAAFNTPIAAVLFSLEEILGDLHAPVMGSVVISSATSWMVLHLILGDEPLFHVPAYQLVSPYEFVLYAVLGVIGGLASVAFVKLLLGLRIWFRRLPKWSVWMQPAVGGLLVGLLGWFLPEVLGVGYDYVERVLGGDLALKTVALLAILKIVATATCYSSGNAGGIFGPSLFIGAMVGGTVGSVAHAILPGSTANPGAYALIGMGTAFAGIVRTPLTSVIMIFEMTRDYSIIVPLMISNLISFFVSYRLQREPIYEALSHQEGVSLPTGETREHMARLTVSDVVESVPTLAVTTPLEPMRADLADGAGRAWPVMDGERLVGLLTAAAGRKMAAGATAGNLAAKEFPFVHPDHPLSLALEKMGDHHLNVLPVVSRANVSQLLGVVTLPEILKAYGVGGPLLGSGGER
nr:chloride channel protein [uncultured Paludibaculum sp.]